MDKYQTIAKLKGLCTSCKKEEALPALTYCTTCKNKAKERHKKRFETEKLLNICSKCKIKKRYPGKQLCFPCYENRMRAFVIYSNNLKHKIFYNYGNMCNCCGENNINLLQIDHINGLEDKKRIVGIKLYNYIINNKYPKTFQLLCASCNWSKGVFGACPHKNDLEIVITPEKFKAMWKVACI